MEHIAFKGKFLDFRERDDMPDFVFFKNAVFEDDKGEKLTFAGLVFPRELNDYVKLEKHRIFQIFRGRPQKNKLFGAIYAIEADGRKYSHEKPAKAAIKMIAIPATGFFGTLGSTISNLSTRLPIAALLLWCFIFIPGTMMGKMNAAGNLALLVSIAFCGLCIRPLIRWREYAGYDEGMRRIAEGVMRQACRRERPFPRLIKTAAAQ